MVMMLALSKYSIGVSNKHLDSHVCAYEFRVAVMPVSSIATIAIVDIVHDLFEGNVHPIVGLRHP